MYFVTRATPIDDIDRKSRKMELKAALIITMHAGYKIGYVACKINIIVCI